MVSSKPNCPHFEISRTHKLRIHKRVATDFNPRSKLISFIQHYYYYVLKDLSPFSSNHVSQRMLHLTQYVLNLKAVKSCLDVHKNGVYKISSLVLLSTNYNKIFKKTTNARVLQYSLL